MNSLERIALTMKFRKPDRLPVIPQILGHTATLLNVPLSDYCRNGEILAKCQLHALDYYQHDAILAIMDVGVEAEALGAKLEYRGEQYPFVYSNAFTNMTNLSTVKVPNPSKDGRMPEILKSISIMRREVEDEVLVVGWVLGPTTLATQLLGMEKALYGAADSPDDFENLLDFCTAVQKVYGQAQLDAGAHLVMIFDPSASPEVVPPQIFRELELPRIQEIFSYFKEKGALASWLHISGQTDSILPYYCSAGVDIANFDYCVQPAVVRELLPRICVDGNIRPLAFIEEDTETVSRLAQQLVQTFSDRGGFILSSGCEIPPQARPDNVKALIAAATKGEKGV